MAKEPEWRWQLVVGLICVAQSFVEWNTPEGPWQEQSFTRGVIALVGLGFVYVAKYRWQFRKDGLIPYLKIYRCKPQQIAMVSVVDGVAAIALILLLKNLSENGVFVPVPASLILLLYAMLMFLHAAYAWLVIEGPLRDEEE
ncbi:hypothetical protein OAV27_00775 [Euryarchaeota archaeon]|nr:hypothetical protein [Euryarchaeota archaeon]|tara:strand:- start:1054 stop:1479 length:426 start_codon:yes stop_codon:yes gene_type:complete